MGGGIGRRDRPWGLAALALLVVAGCASPEVHVRQAEAERRDWAMATAAYALPFPLAWNTLHEALGEGTVLIADPERGLLAGDWVEHPAEGAVVRERARVVFVTRAPVRFRVELEAERRLVPPEGPPGPWQACSPPGAGTVPVELHRRVAEATRRWWGGHPLPGTLADVRAELDRLLVHAFGGVATRVGDRHESLWRVEEHTVGDARLQFRTRLLLMPSAEPEGVRLHVEARRQRRVVTESEMSHWIDIDAEDAAMAFLVMAEQALGNPSGPVPGLVTATN